MFESDDWDLDQDFLNDVDDKAIKYSQESNELHEPKRRKVESNENSSPCYDVNTLEENVPNKVALKHDGNKESRRNLLLGLFNKNLSDEKVPQSTLNDAEKPHNNISLNTNSNHAQNLKSNQIPRKNLVLGILKKKHVQDNIIENHVKTRDVQVFETEVKNNGNVNINEVRTIFNDENKYKASNSTSEIQVNSKHYSYEDSRKQILCNILKQQSVGKINTKNDNSEKKLVVIKPQTHSNKKMTLVRKFPGPAGLLPDEIESNIPNVSYLNSLEESENEKKQGNSNNLAKYCSQTTKNLFSEGAWQLMLDDLPNDFLRGHDIATVKQMATLNGCNGTKVKFLAGIIEHIDFNHDNPPIILKDFTDSIQGIIHRDIPLKYPGLLEINVVVLLHDVGLLRTSGTFVSNKYQILISPSSLLAIYTSKGAIEHTQHLKSVFKNISEKKLNKEESTKNTQSSRNDCQFSQATSSSKRLENSSINTKVTNFSTSLNDTFGNISDSFDFDTDISFSVSSAQITDSQTDKNFKHSAVRKEKCMQSHEKKKPEDLLNGLKKFASDSKEKKYSSGDSTISRLGVEYSKSINICTKKDESELLNDVFVEKMDLDKCNGNASSKKIIYEEESPSLSFRKKNETMPEKTATSIRSKLLQFKAADVTIPLESTACKKDEELPQTKSPETSNNMRSILGDTENDSDDEMLSQLDMDTIFSNYNNTS